MPLNKDDIFAGCRILAVCGEGASGIVYLAEDAVGRKVALKVLHSVESGDRELKGIRNYMRIRQGTPSLVAIHHAGCENGCFFYIMDAADNASDTQGDYLPDTLANRLQSGRRIPFQEAIRLCLTLLDGLSVMHQAGIMHRDIKPENIFFVNGMPVLGDPGLAGSFSRTLSIAGTLGYLPPELFHASEKPSPCSDIYALGKVLYRAVTGNNAGDFPTMPMDMDEDSLAASCRLLAKLCNADKSRRCKDCDECRRLMLEAGTKFGRAWHYWWRLRIDANLRKRLLKTICGIAACLLVVGIGSAYAWHNYREKRRIAAEEALALRTEATSRLNLMRHRWKSLKSWCDATGLSCDEAEKYIERAGEAAASERWHDVLANIKDAEAELEAYAARHLPESAPKDAPLQERLLQNARIFSFLESPLGKWHLSAEVRLKTRRAAENEATHLAMTT